MQVLIGIIIGVFIGIVFMCLFQVNRENECINVIGQLDSALEHERVVAVKEKKSTDYINGMSKVIEFIKEFFKEELKNERLQKKN